MWSVIGHDVAVAALERSFRHGHRAQSFLITGPDQVGKARLAIDLAKALNCTGDQPPCGNCRACLLIEEIKHPDVERVTVGGICDESDHDHRRDGSKDIKICQVRAAERRLALRPFEGRTRVVIFEPADAMNIYAADALLKTLEEPPEQVALILVTASPNMLPETVISRCRHIALGPVGVDIIRETLLNRGVDAPRADLLARLSRGRIGWALASSQAENLLAERARRLDQLEALALAGRAQRMAVAAELATRFASNRQDVYGILDLWQSWWRDVLLAGEGCMKLVAHVDREQIARTIAQAVSPAQVVAVLQAIRACRLQLEQNANPRLALEVLALRLPNTEASEEVGVRGAPPGR